MGVQCSKLNWVHEGWWQGIHNMTCYDVAFLIFLVYRLVMQVIFFLFCLSVYFLQQNSTALGSY